VKVQGSRAVCGRMKAPLHAVGSSPAGIRDEPAVDGLGEQANPPLATPTPFNTSNCSPADANGGPPCLAKSHMAAWSFAVRAGVRLALKRATDNGSPQARETRPPLPANRDEAKAAAAGSQPSASPGWDTGSRPERPKERSTRSGEGIAAGLSLPTNAQPVVIALVELGFVSLGPSRRCAV